MAYFTKRGKTWRAQVSWYDLNNERKYKTKSGFLTKRQAQEWAHKMEVDKDTKQIVATDPTFLKAYTDYVNTYKLAGKTTNTRKVYLNSIKIVKKYFGNMKLSKVNRRVYQSFINEYGKNHAKNTVVLLNRYIKAFVRDSIADRLLSVNFTDRINLVWNDENTHKVQYLSYSEIQKLLKSVETDIKPTDISKYMIITAIYTGMRIGEIMALEWSDIDDKHNLIKISKSYSYVDHKIKAPKNENSKRIIRISGRLIALLNQLKVNNRKFVFMNANGAIPSTKTVSNNLTKHLNSLGIKKDHFHVHSLRHSHVALLLYKGVPLYAISKRLGHADMSITASVYAYMIDELKQKSDDQIEHILDSI